MELRSTSKIGYEALIVFGFLFLLIGCGRSQDLGVAGLKTEYRVNPMGIDTHVPRLSWNLESDQHDCFQSAYQIAVSENKDGLNSESGLVWNTGRVESEQILNIPYSGKPLISGQRYYWRVRVWDNSGRVSAWSEPAYFETALLEPDDWKGRWISDGKPIPEKDAAFYENDPAPLFRKTFMVEKNPDRARLYISGLGYYEARLNSGRVGDRVLDPGWTDYAESILYSIYDVTDQINQGENCLGVMLGNGWYNPLPLRMWGRLNLRDHLPTGRPCVIAQLEIVFSDGSSQIVASDSSWKVHPGPILRNNIYLGEVYDARREVPDWDKPGLDDSSWEQASTAPDPGGRLQAQPQPPIRITGEMKPAAVTEPIPDIYIADLGENFSGWIKLKVRAVRGTRIQLRYGELLYSDGTLNPMTSVCGQIKGLRSDGTPVGGPGAPDVAVQKDVYICKGGGDEVYIPAFTFHAFRYVEIAGLPEPPGPNTVTGLRLHADVASAGTFKCSEPLFNEIQDMTRRTFLSNIFSVQSDCPHRERFQYGGDLAVTADAYMLNFDMTQFYAKAVRDWREAALPDGILTDTAPYVGIQYCGVAWALVHPLLQDALFRWYGNRRLIQEQYSASRQWLDLVSRQYPGHIVTQGLSDHEGLEPAPAPPLVTPLYADAVRIVSRLAGVMGRKAEKQKYQELFYEIREAYLKDFLQPGTGRVEPVTQTSQALALGLELLPESEKDNALGFLVHKIREEHNSHLSTGIYGTPHLLNVLSGMGYAGLAAEIVRQTTFPGWGYMLAEGATTLWEHWAFSDNTYSHNHPMFGSVSAWFYNWLAGIQPHPEAVGFDRFRIRPQPVSGLEWVEAEYKSARGPVRVSWKKTGDEFQLTVSIPPTARAEVFMPVSEPEKIRRISKSANRKDFQWDAGKDFCSCLVGSGTYTFVTELF